MEDQELKFVCKWCNKRYPCGKSLGGHIRAHMIQHDLAESHEKAESNFKKVPSLNGDPKIEVVGHSGYGLRENPKKTLKAVETTITSYHPLPHEKVCKQCGKGFQSMKALCGHMACHSDKDKGLKDDHSWTSENEKLETESESDAESEDTRLTRSTTLDKRYNKRIVIKSSSVSLANGSSSVSEIDDQEKEDVAMCLMMLSKDSSNWGGVNSVVESSDNNSVVLEAKSSSIDMRIGKNQVHAFEYNGTCETPETKKVDSKKLESSEFEAEVVEQENSDSGYYLDECGKLESNGSVDGFYRNAAVYETKRAKVNVGAKDEETLAELRKGFNKMKGECRKDWSRERGNASLMSKLTKYEERKKRNERYDQDVEVLDKPFGKVGHSSPDAQLPKNAHKKGKYECLNCKKVFSSFQALGGHRPCHKKTNAFYESRYETGENSLEVDDDVYTNDKKIAESLSKKKVNAKVSSKKAEIKMNSKKIKVHECPFCHRMFKNGQALGGHKRSHFLGGASVGNLNIQPPAFKEESPELLDLNLPAPMEDEVDENFVSW